jgi:hypothetical protein
MKIFFTILAVTLSLSAILPLDIYPQSTTKSSVPTIDGRINESEWSGAKVFTDYYIYVPKTDEKYYDSTVSYVKNTKDAIYFGIKYWPKGKVISKSLVRDRSTEDENEFFILLDLENKNQNGYIFAFSFLNNQRDMLVYNQRNNSSEWDWIWEVKSTIFKEAKNGEPGYIESEIKIPVDKLQNKNRKQIGFNLQLFAYKEDGNYYYYSITPETELLSLRHMYKYDLTTPFDEKLDFKFNATPYLVGSKFNGDTLRGSLGGDMNVSLDKHTLKGTYNTDESTLEADPVSFNLYNRPTFLQEKRTFFSKDLDIYRTPMNLFYTREIDSINYGANYTYRSDNLKMGAVYVEDEGSDVLTSSGIVERRNKKYFVARPNYHGKDFTFGSMFLYTYDQRLEKQDRVLSFDAFYRFPRNPVRVNAQYVRNFNGENNSGEIYNIYGYWQYNDAGGPYADASYRRVTENFNASTYFDFDVPFFVKNDYDALFLSGGYKFVFDRKYFNDINVNAGYYKAKTLSDKNYGVPFTIQERWSVNSNYKVADWLRFNQYFEYNRPNDFENGELVTRTNTLQDYNASFFLGTNFLSVGYFFGPYYGGFIKNPYISANLFLFDKVAVNGSVNYYDQFGETTTIINGRLDYRFLDKFYVRMFYRKDTQSKFALWNTMLQYEFFAGSSIYFVLNLQGDRLEDTGRYLKMSYEFNF